MFQRNALKFAYLLEYENACTSFFFTSYKYVIYFPLVNTLVYVNIDHTDQGEEGEKIILYVFSYSKIIPEFEVFLHKDSTKHKPLISEEWWETLFLVKASTKTYGKVLHDTEW